MTVPISLVVAMARNRTIGRKGDIPWKLKGEQAHFKAVTLGKPVIMGRKTWESLPRKPLPKRPNIVLTRDGKYRADGAEVVTTVEAAIAAAQAHEPEEIAVIGGAEIYALFLDRAELLYLTWVEAEIEGDAHFPAFDPAEWTLAEMQSVAAGEGIDYPYTIEKRIGRTV